MIVNFHWWQISKWLQIFIECKFQIDCKFSLKANFKLIANFSWRRISTVVLTLAQLWPNFIIKVSLLLFFWSSWSQLWLYFVKVLEISVSKFWQSPWNHAAKLKLKDFKMEKGTSQSLFWPVPIHSDFIRQHWQSDSDLSLLPDFPWTLTHLWETLPNFETSNKSQNLAKSWKSCCKAQT